MEEHNMTENVKFMERVDDEVDVRIGTNAIAEDETAKENQNLGKRCFPPLCPRKKVIWISNST